MKQVRVKNPGPEDQTLISPPKGLCLPTDSEWNIGMVEKWNGEYEKLSAIFFTKDLLPLYPIFHHSSFPIPQDI